MRLAALALLALLPACVSTPPEGRLTARSEPPAPGPDSGAPPIEPEPPPPDLGDYEALFDVSVLQEIRLTLTPEDIGLLDEDGSVWVPAGFEHDGNLIEVAVHLKGTTTYQDFSGKPAFRVKFNERVPGQEYAGLKRLALNNMLTDPAQGREVIAWQAWGAGGMPVPRATLATVHVNEEYFGLYAAIEGMDGEYLERRYTDPTGDLWAANDHADLTPEGILAFDLNSGASLREDDLRGVDRSSLQRASDALGEWSADLLTPAATVVDMDQYLDFQAWTMVTGWVDGYPYHYNDYFVYADPADGGRLDFTPWGLDEAWSDEWTFGYGNGVLGWRCAQDPACGEALQTHIAAVLLDYEAIGVGAIAAQVFALSDAAAAEDPRKPFAADAVRAARGRLVDQVTSWPDRVRSATGR
ncbi:MAG: CotH kinase family protein [Pseudomonadota bacterium]|nr:CotH kinase family protein [Pseudomonadota bacterium]